MYECVGGVQVVYMLCVWRCVEIWLVEVCVDVCVDVSVEVCVCRCVCVNVCM